MQERRTGAKHAMRAVQAMTVGIGAWLAALPARAVTLDFESSVYIHDRSIDQVDGWSRSSVQGGDSGSFRIFAEASGAGAPGQVGNKWLRVRSDVIGTLRRTFPANSALLDLQWRWRASDPGANFCLGVSGSAEDVRGDTRSLVCLHPGGIFEAWNAPSTGLTEAKETWQPGQVYHMRMRLDAGADTYSIYLALDSLRADERLLAGPLKMGGIPGGVLTRVVARPEGGAGTVDVDDIRWETVAAWKGTEADSLASNPRNWSTGVLPDSLTQVRFGADAQRGCLVDKGLAVRSITVERGFTAGLHFGTTSLSVSGHADFTGLRHMTTSTGGIRFTSSRAQSLIAAEAGLLPYIYHDGAGILRLDDRALLARAFSQTAGTLDLNGRDLSVETDLVVTGGSPRPLLGLAGRALAAGKSIRLEGTAAARLDLQADAPWSLSAAGEITARYVTLRNASAKGVTGVATNSDDKGGNPGWVFSPSQADTTAPPRAIPPGGSFTDSMTVTLEPGTEGSGIYYTLDGGTPTKDARYLYTRPFVLKASAVLRAKAVKDGLLDSRVASWSFTRINQTGLEKPFATPPGGIFKDSVQVTLGHPADTSADPPTLWYRLDDGFPLPYAGPFHVHPPAILRAFAVRGDQQSDTALWTFSSRLEAPTIRPAGRKFPDTLRVTLDSPDAGVSVFYTLDGRDPDSSSLPYLGGSIRLDSTVTLKAVAIRPGAARSLVRIETFELVPDSLTANYRSGDYSSAIQVKLVSTSARARIHYTLDGSEPGPGLPGSRLYVEGTSGFRLDTTATLRALAVAGEGATFRKGREFTARYTFIDARTRTLGPGQKVEISSRYSLTNPLAGAPPVIVEVIKADSLSSLRGFRDVQFGLKISLPSQSGAFPQLILASPTGEERSLYSLTGAVRFVSSADTLPLPSTGTYFLGVDTAPPKVVWTGESFQGDSTRIVFNLEDNVSGFAWDVERSHGAPLRGQTLDNSHILVLTLKAPEGPFAPLWVRLKVDDRRNQVRFPADPAAVYPLSQRHSQPVRGPAVLKVGTSAERPWDMVSVPLDMPGGFTWARLKRENGDRALAAKVMDPSTGKYRDMREGEALRPGTAAWLASDAPLGSLALGALQTAPRQGREAVTVTLKPGWNQVSNPTLTPLFWPHGRGTPGYETSLVKALHGYNPSLPGTGYFETDTLVPWKGYFVFHKGRSDSIIVLGTAAPMAKRSAGNRSQGLRIRLRVERLPALRLGAQPFAGDGLGVEDEPQPPAPSAGPERGPRLWSERQRLRLGTDILGFRPGEAMAWRVVAVGSIQDTSSSGGARVESLELPEGYAAWAVSRSRGLRFALREDARIPLSPDAADSLDIHAGPAALLEARLGGIPEQVGEFHARARARPDGYVLDLALPFAARIRWSLWSLDGKRLDGDSKVLPPGRYDLARGGRGRAFRGACALRLDWTAAGSEENARRRGTVVRALVLP